MSRFVISETDAIDLGDGDVVHLKRRMNYGDQRVLSSTFTGGEASGGMREYLVVLLERNIVRWEGPGFTGPDGSPVPITREAIDALDPDVADRLVDEIARRNPTAAARPLAQSAPSSSSPSPTAERSSASTPSSGSADASAGPGTSS